MYKYQGLASVEIVVNVDGHIFSYDGCDYSEFIQECIKDGSIESEPEEISKSIYEMFINNYKK